VPIGAQEAGVGVAIGAFAVAALVLRPVVGWASDRFGRRPLLLLGGTVTVAALALHLVATTLPLFIGVRALLGVGEAFYFVAALAAISDLAPPNRRGEAINVGSLSVYLGLALGPAIGESILAAAGFDAVWFAASLTAIAATALVLFVPETAPVSRRSSSGSKVRGRLIHPAAVFPGLLILSGAWGMAGFLAFVPLHASDVGMSGAGAPLALYALIVVGLRIVFVKLPDQVGAARLSGAALAVEAVGLVLIGLLASPAGLLIGSVVFALGIAFMFPALVSLAISRVDDMERGRVVGTTSAFLDLAFGFAPALLGAMAGQTGYAATFVVSGVIAAVGSVALFARRSSLAARPTLTP
jgi:MFS family permease